MKLKLRYLILIPISEFQQKYSWIGETTIRNNYYVLVTFVLQS